MSWYDLIGKNGTAVIPDGTVEIKITNGILRWV